MPTSLMIQIFVDNPTAGTHKDAAKSVAALIGFLNNLDGPAVPNQGFSVSAVDSAGNLTRNPVEQDITIYSQDQALAIGHILKGWALLSILKRVEVAWTDGKIVITHETDIEEEMRRIRV